MNQAQSSIHEYSLTQT